MRPTTRPVEDWLTALSGVLAAIDRPEFAPALVTAVQLVVPGDQGLIRLVSRDAAPRVVFDEARGGPCSAERVARRPGSRRLAEYDRALLAGRCGFRTGSEEPPGAQARHAVYLAPVPPDAGVVMLLLRRAESPAFSSAELACLRALAPGICTALRLHWGACARPSPDDEALHRQVEAALDRFGHATLTAREAQVIRLLLRGHSTRETAERLGIAPATAALHRKRAYSKLGVRSQGQLFHHFIQSLERPPAELGISARAAFRELSSRRQPAAAPVPAGLS